MPNDDVARPMLVLSALAAVLALAAVAAAALVPDVYAAVPPAFVPGAYGQDTVTAFAAVALLGCIRRIRAGHRAAWLV